MTLQDIFSRIDEDPTYVLIYFVSIPLLTLVFAWIGKDDTNKSPWKYIYSGLIYLSAIPGIFAAAITIYTFLFEDKSFLELNVLIYFLPIISMLVSFIILQRNMNLDDIPGFGKLSGLLMTISATIAVMFVLDRTNIIAFIAIPISYLVLVLIGFFVLFRLGQKKLF